MLIINADDWGLSAATTDKAADCFLRNRISAVSAMVFMRDSERAAGVARDIGIDVGLHLNFTEAYSSPRASEALKRAQNETARFLSSGRFSAVIYNPRLRAAFATTLSAQVEEFRRLYGADPTHLDGHHHQHLSANVLFGRLLPHGAIVRRHFTFFAGEKSKTNRAYRALCDWYLSRRCVTLDGFFDLVQYMGLERLGKLSKIAEHSVVELMTHPAQPADYEYLVGDEFGAWLDGIRLTSFRELAKGDRGRAFDGNRAARAPGSAARDPSRTA